VYTTVVPTIRHDPEQGLFVAEVGEAAATLAYRRTDEHTVDLQSTFVPHELRNQYVGTQLVRHALTWARSSGLRVIPSCWFVRMLMDREPQWRELIADPK